MNPKELAKQNKILEIITGSHLYGTATPNSDFDYIGIFMPWDNLVFGFERADQVDISFKSKRDDGRNDKDAVDFTYYELRKFIKLAMQNNPNIIEVLFVNSDNVRFINNYGYELIKHRELFPYAGLKERFLGYATSQKKKMVIRTEHFHDIKMAREWFQENLSSMGMKQKMLAILAEEKNLPFLKPKKGHISIGDINIQKHFKLGKVQKMVNERFSKVTNRSGLMEKYGYDTKFASHLIRLLLEGIELLQTGKIEFPLKERELLLDIKKGKYSMELVLKIATELEDELSGLFEITELPKKPRYNQIQELSKKLIKKFILDQ